MAESAAQLPFSFLSMCSASQASSGHLSPQWETIFSWARAFQDGCFRITPWVEVTCVTFRGGTWWRCCKQGPCVSAQLLHFLGQRLFSLHSPSSHPSPFKWFLQQSEQVPCLEHKWLLKYEHSHCSATRSSTCVQSPPSVSHLRLTPSLGPCPHPGTSPCLHRPTSQPSCNCPSKAQILEIL